MGEEAGPADPGCRAVSPAYWLQACIPKDLPHPSVWAEPKALSISPVKPQVTQTQKPEANRQAACIHGSWKTNSTARFDNLYGEGKWKVGGGEEKPASVLPMMPWTGMCYLLRSWRKGSPWGWPLTSSYAQHTYAYTHTTNRQEFRSPWSKLDWCCVRQHSTISDTK